MSNDISALSRLEVKLQGKKKKNHPNSFSANASYKATKVGPFAPQTNNAGDPTVDRVRIEGVHDHIMDDYTGYSDARQQQFAHGMHPTVNKDSQVPLSVGSKYTLQHIGHEGTPENTGRTNGLRVVGHDGIDTTQLGNLALVSGLAVFSAANAFANGGAAPSPSKPRAGADHLRQADPTKDTQIPGSFMPATTRITSPYGMRIHPIYKTQKMHGGLDFNGGKRSAAKHRKENRVPPKSVATNPNDIEPCYSIFDGEVTKQYAKIPSSKGYGAAVYITHKVPDKGGTERTIVSVYGHIEHTPLKKGDTVTRGQLVGHIGSQGGSTGPHLHFEVRENGKHIDPVELFAWAYGPAPNADDHDFPEEDLEGAEDE